MNEEDDDSYKTKTYTLAQVERMCGKSPTTTRGRIAAGLWRGLVEILNNFIIVGKQLLLLIGILLLIGLLGPLGIIIVLLGGILYMLTKMANKP